MRQRFAYCLAFPCLYLLHRMAGFPFLPSENSLNQLFPRPRYFSPPQLSRRRRRHRGACISNIYLPIAFSPLLMLLIFQLSFIVLWGCFSLPRIIGVLQPHFTPIAGISYQIPPSILSRTFNRFTCNSHFCRVLHFFFAEANSQPLLSSSGLLFYDDTRL